MEVPDDDETWCRSCASHVAVRDGQEHTGYCDQCAQDLVTKMALALARILEHAKAIGDLTDEQSSASAFNRIAQVAYEALGKPSMADLDDILGK